MSGKRVIPIIITITREKLPQPAKDLSVDRAGLDLTGADRETAVNRLRSLLRLVHCPLLDADMPPFPVRSVDPRFHRPEPPVNAACSRTRSIYRTRSRHRRRRRMTRFPSSALTKAAAGPGPTFISRLMRSCERIRAISTRSGSSRFNGRGPGTACHGHGHGPGS